MPLYNPSGSDPTVSVTTTDATPATIITIPVTGTLAITAKVTARSSTGVSGSYEVKASAKNVSGTVTLIGQVAVATLTDQDAWSVSAAVSGTDLLIRVTGEAATTIAWDATWSLI